VAKAAGGVEGVRRLRKKPPLLSQRRRIVNPVAGKTSHFLRVHGVVALPVAGGGSVAVAVETEKSSLRRLPEKLLSGGFVNGVTGPAKGSVRGHDVGGRSRSSPLDARVFSVAGGAENPCRSLSYQGRAGCPVNGVTGKAVREVFVSGFPGSGRYRVVATLLPPLPGVAFETVSEVPFSITHEGAEAPGLDMRVVAIAAGGAHSPFRFREDAVRTVLPPCPYSSSGVADKTVVAAVTHLLLPGGGGAAGGKKVEGTGNRLFDSLEVADAAAAGNHGNAALPALFTDSGTGEKQKQHQGEEDETVRHYSRARLKM
jgi:hypothetical protein